MINCIIIDDEDHAIEVLRKFCKKIPYLSIIGEFNDPTAAASFIDLQKDKIDLVFLDVEMPCISGRDFLKSYSFPHVIMVTAYTSFALESYQYGVSDYLHKPFSFERFALAVSKVYNRIKGEAGLSTEQIVKERDVLFIKVDRQKYIKLTYAEIKYIKSAKNNLIIYTTDSKIILGLRLNALEEQLRTSHFMRIHRSYLINMDYVKSVEGNLIKLHAVEEVFQLGPTYRQAFMEYIHDRTRT